MRSNHLRRIKRSYTRLLHWNIPDPASAVDSPEQELGQLRRVRDETTERVCQLIAEARQTTDDIISQPKERAHAIGVNGPMRESTKEL